MGKGPLCPLKSPLPKSTVHVFDPEQLIRDIISADLDPSVFEFEEEKDLVKAPNAIVWVHDSRFLGLNPYPKQVEILLNLHEDHCPNCTDPAYQTTIAIPNTQDVIHRLDIPFDEDLGNVLDRIQLLDFGICPKCGGTREQFQREKLFSNPNELTACLGMRSGKTSVVAMIWSYMLHRFLCISNPARTFGLMPNQPIQSTFCAPTATQAYETLWQQSMAVYDACPWFKKYGDFLNAKGKQLGIKNMYSRGDSFIWFGNKKISASYQAADPRTIRGRTRWFCAIDELSHFDAVDNTKVRMNGHETYEALVKSLRTIRSSEDLLHRKGQYNLPTAIMANISSPASVQDKLMQLLRKQRDMPSPRMVSLHAATWEFNPYITKESLAQELSTPAGIRDYGAVPPLAMDPFFPDPNILEGCVDPEGTTILTYGKQHKVEQIGGMKSQYCYAIINTCKGDKFTPRVIGVDAGESYNSFALVIAHYDVKFNRTIIDAAIEIQPMVEEHITVHFPTMFDNVISHLIDKLNIRYVIYDRWNSSDHINRARALYVKSDKYSLNRQDFLSFRTRLENQEIIFPKPEIPIADLAESNPRTYEPYPISHLLLQILTVREVGNKVIKPLNGFDDLFRATALCEKWVFDHKKELSVIGADGFFTPETHGIVRGYSTVKDLPVRSSGSRLGTIKRSNQHRNRE